MSLYTLFIAGTIFILLLGLGFILTRLYKRASKDVSFVRTGFGGQKVIVDGGAIVLPILHEIIPVNMQTLQLPVERQQNEALITQDRMRIDVKAEFYLKVSPTVESISAAAQTLGHKTNNIAELKKLMEGKFVDALRSVAAEMRMEELHEKRTDFVQKVQSTLNEELSKNGLELETVSLTGLDQTDFKFFNPQNAFDAEGLTKLTETIETRRKKRNEIEQDTDLSIKRKNLIAEQERLSISRDEEYARIEQERELAIRKAETEAMVAESESVKQREAEEAKIENEKNVEMQRIQAKQETENARIAQEQSVEQAEVARAKMIELAERDKAIAIAIKTKEEQQARASAETAKVLADKEIKEAEIKRQEAIALAEQEKAIAVAERSKAESEANKLAALARAEAIKAEETATTVRETEIANRNKTIQLIAAEEAAQKDAIAITVAAEADKKAATDRAEAIRVQAEADAERERITAKGMADAEMLLAEAKAKQYTVDAEGQKAINEAANVLSKEQIQMQMRFELLKHLPSIISESVKPINNIDSIRIAEVSGLGGQGNTTLDANGNIIQSNGSLSDQIVNSALRYRSQMPLVDGLLHEVGLTGGDISKMTGSLLGNVEEQKPTDNTDIENKQ